jgi:hypothetical protein
VSGIKAATGMAGGGRAMVRGILREVASTRSTRETAARVAA